ncbi:MAG: hypothetical protein ACKVT2_22110 [Saprospiraceae bacterium]
MKPLSLLFLGICLSLSSFAIGSEPVLSEGFDIENQHFIISINKSGRIIHLMDKRTQTDYAVDRLQSPILALMVNKTILPPQKAIYLPDDARILLQFQTGLTAQIQVAILPSHISFELIALSDEASVEVAIWGPYATQINGSIGETIGIVQNESFTIGIQALNPKTLGGYPWKDNDHLPQMDIFEQEDFEDVTHAKRGVLYSVEAAKPTDFGSTLQAYTRNRSKDRIIENWGHQRYVAPAFADGGLIGSKIALFACATDQTLATIGAIEIAEGLPHPTFNGQWVKTSPLINASYLIMDFDESNIDECLGYAQQAGLHYLYHGDPFSTWGKYDLKPGFFPTGIAGLKACVQKGEQKGIYLGTHTLSNFINTEDAYVTPVPDKRLAKVGGSVLSKAINATQTEIEIEDPSFFNQFENNHLHGVQIGDEIIRYGTVSESAPWKLLDCTRGAFGTQAAAYAQGAKIEKLADHGYKVFLGDAALNKEIAENVAEVFNATGIRMLDFDGLEGAHSTGLGNYGEALFAKAWYDQLDDNIKNHFLLGASRSGHYFWHIYSRMNWGEPWYAGFRESQTEYRLLNQKYYKRNLMPGMLGWFKMTASTTIEDIEWLMTRSAAYNAGFAFVMDLKAVKGSGVSAEILNRINLWETARLQGVLPEEITAKMRDLSTEFHLEKGKGNTLNLTQVYSHKFRHLKKERQPGEPLSSTFSFENKAAKQVMGFIISAAQADISKLTLEINHSKSIDIPVELKKGQSIKYSGGKDAVLYDAQWNQLKVISVLQDQLMVSAGKNDLSFDCVFSETDQGVEAYVNIEIRLLDAVVVLSNK